MGIWERLGIEPTKDKRQIKRAYAARSREVHPEEKPEEFRMLYEAYQAALAYARREKEKPEETKDQKSQDRGKSGLKQEEEPSGKSAAEGFEQPKETEAERQLRAYLERQSEEQEEKLADFLEHWKEINNFELREPRVQEWWREYLQSKDFQSIQWHPKLLKLLSEEMEQKLSYDYVIRILFWDAYDFRHVEEDKGTAYQDDLKRLRKSLQPAFDLRMKEKAFERQLEEKRLAHENRVKSWIQIGIAAAVLLAVLVPFSVYRKVTAERRYVEAYMKEEYPETKFSKPEKITDSQEEAFYELYSKSHPDLPVTVRLEYDEKGRISARSEDYGLQLLEYYAEQYGMNWGRMEKGGYDWPEDYGNEMSVLYYSAPESLEEFCDTVMRMFQEQEELWDLSAIGIGKEDVLYPEIFVNGGMEDFSLVKSPFYRPWEMEAQELKQSVWEAYVQYTFHFEAWKLTAEQYAEWGPAYEELCKKLVEEIEADESFEEYGSWYELYLGEEAICDIYIPIYTGEWEEPLEYGQSITRRAKMFLIGDAYHYLLFQGADLTITDDGSGFAAELDGNICFFGEEPREEMIVVKAWCPKDQSSFSGEEEWEGANVVTGPEVEIE